MHVSEGVLSAPVLAMAGAGALAGLGIGLGRTRYEDIPKVALLSSAFFVASLVHVPLGPSSVHLVLNGIAGLLLGWAAVPAIFVGVLLQALLFQFGGLTTLGVQTVVMGFPAVIVHYLFRKPVLSKRVVIANLSAFLSGAFAVLLSTLFFALVLATTDESFLPVAQLVLAAHIPIMVIEGFITLFVMAFLRKVKPEILTGQ